MICSAQLTDATFEGGVLNLAVNKQSSTSILQGPTGHVLTMKLVKLYYINAVRSIYKMTGGIVLSYSIVNIYNIMDGIALINVASDLLKWTQETTSDS